MRSRPRSRARRTSGSRATAAAPIRPGTPGRCLADPPGQPSTVPVYDPGTGTGRMLALDLDASRGDVDHAARPRSATRRSTRLGARCLTDASPAGGRHVFVLFAAPLPWRELRDVARALALRFPSIDTAPMSARSAARSALRLLATSPEGGACSRARWRTATAAVEQPNGPEVWAALLTEFAAELQPIESQDLAADVSHD